MENRKTIAVNTRFLLANKLEGIGRFTCETLKYLSCQHPEHDFVFLFDRPYDPAFIFADNVTPMVIGPPARHPFLWYLWFEYAIPRALKKCKADLFLSTDGFLSLSTDVPTLMVVHDIAFEHYPMHVPYWARKYYQHFSPKYAEKATRISSVSHFTKQDLVSKYGITPDKIDVSPNGCNGYFNPLAAEEQIEIRAKHAKNCEYFVFVGAIHPRKNVANIFTAFDHFKKNNQTDMKLVIAGREAWECKAIMATYEAMKHKEEVIFLGHLQTDELAKVMASAKALVYTSLFEGFGLPILEAMSCQVPVITSNVSSMPEVAGDAALLVDPTSYEAISDAMTQLYINPSLCQTLTRKGLKQREHFTWKKTAQTLWKSIDKTLQTKSNTQTVKSRNQESFA